MSGKHKNTSFTMTKKVMNPISPSNSAATTRCDEIAKVLGVLEANHLILGITLAGSSTALHAHPQH